MSKLTRNQTISEKRFQSVTPKAMTAARFNLPFLSIVLSGVLRSLRGEHFVYVPMGCNRYGCIRARARAWETVAARALHDISRETRGGLATTIYPGGFADHAKPGGKNVYGMKEEEKWGGTTLNPQHPDSVTDLCCRARNRG